MTWRTLTLRDACDFRPAKAEARSRLSGEDRVSFVPMEDLGVVARSVLATKDRSLAEVASSYTYFADGDVLLAKITPCFENGKLGIARDLSNGAGFGSSEYHVIRPKSEISAEWLFYFLARDSFRRDGASVMTGSVGHRRVPQEFLEALRIPVPPVGEQKRIVGILDEAFGGIAKAKSNAERTKNDALLLYKQLRQDLLGQEISNCRHVSLGEITEVQSGGTPTVSRKDYWSGGIPWYSSGELNDDFTADPLRTISAAGLESSNAKLFPAGSLLIGMYDTAALKMSILDRPAAFNQAVAGAKPSSNLNLRFVQQFIDSRREEIRAERRGVRQKNLSLTKIKSISIPTLPKAKQDQIVERLSTFDESCSAAARAAAQKLVALDALKQSILHHAFTGQL